MKLIAHVKSHMKQIEEDNCFAHRPEREILEHNYRSPRKTNRLKLLWLVQHHAHRLDPTRMRYIDPDGNVALIITTREAIPLGQHLQTGMCPQNRCRGREWHVFRRVRDASQRRQKLEENID